MRLDRLLRPRSVAVVGATERPGSYGGEVLLNLARMGFRGSVFAVNPRRDSVHGVPCVPSLRDVPEVPDAVAIAVPAAAAPAVVAEAGALGCGGAVVLAAGFAEGTGAGTAAHHELVAAARAHGLPVCGPNGNGVVCVPARVALWGDGIRPLEPGPVALISQSGNVAVNALASRRGLRLHTVVSTGNQAVLDAADFLEALAAQEGVRSVALYLEDDGDGVRWCSALERCARAGIGVAVLKAGSSAAGAAAARSHTGALAGDQRIVRALFEECGAAWARDPHELLELAKALAVRPPGGARAGSLDRAAPPEGHPRDHGAPPEGRSRDHRASLEGGSRVAVMTCSGGDASVAADRAQELGVALPALAPDTVARLREVLPPVAPAENPLDYTALLWDEPAKLGRIVDVLAADPAVDRVLVFFDDASDADESWTAVLDAVREAGARSPVPVAVASTLPELLSDASAARLQADGVAAFAGLETALRCLRALGAPPADPARIAALGDAAAPAPGRNGGPSSAAPGGPSAAAPAGPSSAARGGASSAAVFGASASADGWLAEHDAKALLRAAGLPVPDGRLVADADDAVAALRELGGAVALKRSEPGLLHKAAVGAVAVGLASDETVRAAHARIASGPVLVERMAPPGVELVVAARRGLVPALVVGLGGALAEQLDDVAIVPLPADAERVERALRTLRGAAALHGVDVNAVVRLAARLGELLLEDAGLHEIELNPVIAHPDGAVAVDALARRTTQEET